MSSKALPEHAAVSLLVQSTLDEGGVRCKLSVHELHALTMDVARPQCGGCRCER